MTRKITFLSERGKLGGLVQERPENLSSGTLQKREKIVVSASSIPPPAQDIVKSTGGSTTCFSHIIFILVQYMFLCLHRGLFTFIVLLAPFFFPTRQIHTKTKLGQKLVKTPWINTQATRKLHRKVGVRDGAKLFWMDGIQMPSKQCTVESVKTRDKTLFVCLRKQGGQLF